MNDHLQPSPRLTGNVRANAPIVSVTMATRNYGRFIAKAIDSVVSQTFTDWELVIVDDGSTDNTPAVLQPYLIDPRIRFVRADRLGPPRAKSLGVRLSRGQFVGLLDADDIWQPTKLERQLALFQGRPEIGVVFCRRSLIDEAGNPLPARLVPDLPRGRILERMFVQNHVCFSSAVVRRLVFDHIGGFNAEWDLAIDYDLWLRVAKHYEFDYVDDELVQYRTGHGNLSKRISDRVAIALSMMHRAQTRYELGDEVGPDQIAAGYASTCQTLGYIMRASEPMTALKWYLRALGWANGRMVSAKGVIASLLVAMRRKRILAAAENASVNI